MSLSVVIRTGYGLEPFTSDRSLAEADVVVGLGRPASIRAHPAERVALED